MKSSRRILLLMAPVLLTACIGNPLPEERPDDFSASYMFDGGMMFYSERFRTFEDGALFDVLNGGVTLQVSFQPSEEELDELYAAFRENEFTRIKSTSEEDVYDRGGYSITMQWDDQRYGVSDSGIDFVKPRWSGKFNSVLGALFKLSTANESTPNMLTISWDSSAQDNSATVTIDLEGNYAGVSVSPSENVMGIAVKQLDGIYPVTVTLEQSGVTESFDLDIISSSDFDISVDSNESLVITLLDQ